MRILYDGDWRPVSILGVGDGTQLRPVTVLGDAGTVEATLTVADIGPFQPWVTVWSGGSIEWLDQAGTVLSTDLQPSLAGHTTYRLRATPDAVRTLNLGFDHTDDAGREGPGAGQDWPATTVTGITGLTGFTSLEAVMAASTQLTGHLDLTGLASLLWVECFSAYVQSVTLTGCTSLTRLCLEHCSVTALDLNPVRATLRDLRCAEQRAGSLAFATLTGPMQHLWHYCTRDTLVSQHIPLSQMPAIEQWWPWNTGMTAMDAPVSPVAQSMVAYDNSLNQASVDAILTGLRDHSTQGPYSTVDLTGSAAPSATGLAAAATLRGRGWTVAHS